MFRLIEAFLGVMLFLFLGSLLVLKNQDNQYAFKTSRPYSHPTPYIEEEIQKAFQSVPLAAFFPWEVNTASLKSSFVDHAKTFFIEDNYYGKHQISYKLDTLKKTIALNVKGEKNMLMKLYGLLNPNLQNESKRKLSLFLKEELHAIEKQYDQHRISWKGIQRSAPIYYLALEKKWDIIPNDTIIAAAQSELLAFAEKRQIPPEGEPFTVYPLSSRGEKVWRFALPVGRYYNTQSKTIRCRRYKGGKYISLIHYGTAKGLEKSWQQLQDSLNINGYTLGYPPMERYPRNRKNESNPYKWETELILAVKE